MAAVKMAAPMDFRLWPRKVVYIIYISLYKIFYVLGLNYNNVVYKNQIAVNHKLIKLTQDTILQTSHN
jgi:hypothetical protein